jgi:hypothetical protein
MRTTCTPASASFTSTSEILAPCSRLSYRRGSCPHADRRLLRHRGAALHLSPDRARVTTELRGCERDVSALADEIAAAQLARQPVPPAEGAVALRDSITLYGFSIR